MCRVSWVQSTKGGWQEFIIYLFYLLQGVLVGLAFGPIPFLLKKQVVGGPSWFTLASYPYSLKLLWSPIVNVLLQGRHETWIVPI